MPEWSRSVSSPRRPASPSNPAAPPRGVCSSRNEVESHGIQFRRRQRTDVRHERHAARRRDARAADHLHDHGADAVAQDQDRPAAADPQSAPPDNPPEPITLGVKTSGQLYWNDEPITEAALQAQLRVTSQKNPQPELQIQADKTAKYQQVATVMADAKNAGIDEDRLPAGARRAVAKRLHQKFRIEDAAETRRLALRVLPSDGCRRLAARDGCARDRA